VRTEELDEFARKYRVALPDDLCAYFAAINGMEDSFFDMNMMSFWRLSRVVPLPDPKVWGYKDVPGLEDVECYFVFGDFMIESHYYAIKLTENGEDSGAVISTAADCPYRVADSFGEFLWLYLNDNDKAL